MKLKRRKPKWVISGPWYSDGRWLVCNVRHPIHESLTHKWFDTRQEAREFQRRKQRSGRHS